MIQRGYTLIELLVALTLAALLMAGLAGVTGNALQISDAGRERLELNRQARFAMDRIVRMVSGSPGLVLPLADNPATAQSEYIHTALAILLPRDSDLDGNGVADADGDPFTGTDAGLLWLRVSLAGTALAVETLTAQ